MQEKRLELSWYCYHTDLNRARLPIPPFLRTIAIISFFFVCVNSFFKNFVEFGETKVKQDRQRNLLYTEFPLCYNEHTIEKFACDKKLYEENGNGQGTENL